VKDKFNYDWDQFSAAFANTPVGNNGNTMVPFFRPEISPRVDMNAPILKGSDSFTNWDEADAAIRACVEGQAINIKLCSDWMQLKPEVIYLTGGASKNDEIAQVIADVFQAKVQRLAVSGSVGLGAAMRAASNSLGCSISDLEAQFCKPEANSTIAPKAAANAYDATAKAFIESLS